jgi:hypothetical protein
MDPDELRFFEATVGLRPRKERCVVPRSTRREILSLVRQQDDKIRRGSIGISGGTSRGNRTPWRRT